MAEEAKHLAERVEFGEKENEQLHSQLNAVNDYADVTFYNLLPFHKSLFSIRSMANMLNPINMFYKIHFKNNIYHA